MKTLEKIASSAVISALILTAPGLGFYQAFARVQVKAPKSGPVRLARIQPPMIAEAGTLTNWNLIQLHLQKLGVAQAVPVPKNIPAGEVNVSLLEDLQDMAGLSQETSSGLERSSAVKAKKDGDRIFEREYKTQLDVVLGHLKAQAAGSEARTKRELARSLRSTIKTMSDNREAYQAYGNSPPYALGNPVPLGREIVPALKELKKLTFSVEKRTRGREAASQQPSEAALSRGIAREEFFHSFMLELISFKKEKVKALSGKRRAPGLARFASLPAWLGLGAVLAGSLLLDAHMAAAAGAAFVLAATPLLGMPSGSDGKKPGSFAWAQDALEQAAKTVEYLKVPLEKIKSKEGKLFLDKKGPLEAMGPSYQQLGNILGIPVPYIHKLRYALPGLLDENINQLIARKIKVSPREAHREYLVRLREGKISAVLTDQYAVIKHVDFLKLISEIIPEGRISAMVFDGDNLKLRIVLPGKGKNPDFAAGVVLTNSETGQLSIRSYPFVASKTESAGFIWESLDGVALARRHVGNLSLTQLKNDLNFNIPRQIELAEKKIGRLLELRRIPVEKEDAKKMIAYLSQKFKLTQKAAQSWWKAFEKDPQLSALGVLQALIRSAQDYEFELQDNIEHLSGKMAELDWKEAFEKAKAEMTPAKVKTILALRW